MTRHLFAVVNSARSWDSEVLLSEDSISEINFWVNNVHSLNGKVYWGVQSLPVKVSFSDASGSACGAYVQSDSDLVFHQNWSPAESVQSSTWRELKAACLALEAFASRLSDSKVIWYSDNQNVESILLNGSKKSDLQELAFHICLEYRISLDVKWTRGISMRQPILSASLLILMIMLSVMSFSSKLIAFGVRILLIGSPVTTMLTLGFFSWAVRLSTPSLRIGEMIIIGFVPQFASSSEF